MPTLNEEEGIAECIQRIQNATEQLGISAEIIISDSSTDRTPDIARAHGATVVKPDKPGYGYAYRYAFERANGEYIAIGDADTTYDFEELVDLFPVVAEGSADMVLGSRLDGEIKPGAMPALHRYIGNPLLTRFLNLFYGTEITDAHSGFRVFKREALEELDLQSDGMEFASEMIMEAAESDLEIDEVPIVYHRRTGEATLDSFQDGWRHVRFMLQNAPGYLFSAPSAGLLMLGPLLMLISVLNIEIMGTTFGMNTVIFGSFLSIVGYQIGTLALSTSVSANPVRRPDDPITDWIHRNFKLEYGLVIGGLLVLIGGTHTAYLAGTWVLQGFPTTTVQSISIFAFTTFVLGLQTIFFSFFLSLLMEQGTDTIPETPVKQGANQD